MFRFLRPTFRHGLLIVLGGFAFALAGCLGGISAFSYDSSSPLGWVGVAALLVGLLVMLVGGLLLVIATFKKIFDKRDGTS
jgi:hypothetical protein